MDACLKQVIIFSPVANEENYISIHTKKLLNLEVYGYNFLFIFVLDEYSTDSTQSLIEDVSKSDNRFIVHKFQNGKGLANAYLEGYRKCLDHRSDIIIEMDIESHPISEIPKILAQLECVDMVFMSRNLSGAENKSHFRRRIISLIGTMLSKFLLRLKLSDNTSGYQAFKTNVIRHLKLDNFVATSYLFQTEMKYRCTSILKDSYEKEVASTVLESEHRQFYKEFITNSKKYTYSELPFTYKNSKSSISFYKVYNSFIEFLRLVRNKDF